MRFILFATLFVLQLTATAQDTTVILENKTITLPHVVVRNNLDYRNILARIKNDSSFYKAFCNLRVLQFSAFNDIRFYDKKHKETKATYYSKTRQHRSAGCRSTEVLERTVTGDFYKDDSSFNYLTAEMYASLFFAKGLVCGETNIVANRSINTKDKKGISKHKEQLKMLFFNPGKKIPGIPFIGNRLDLYDGKAVKDYDYRLDAGEYNGHPSYTFSITPKEGKKEDVVITEMITVFDAQTMDVLKRTYSLVYNAGVYDFDVSMEVELEKFGGLLVPKTLRYRGNWDVIFKKRENAEFTATLFDFANEK
jgi:hypothetical protein